MCDASALVALLVDGGESGEWAAATVIGHQLIAPHLMMFEVANILRRHELAGLVSADQAAQAHRDLLDPAIDLWPYEAVATRACGSCAGTCLPTTLPMSRRPRRRVSAWSRWTSESDGHRRCAATC